MYACAYTIADKEKAAVSKQSLPDSAAKAEEDRKKPVKTSDNQRRTREASAEEISEFFGEARKCSEGRLQADTEDDSDIEEASKERRQDSSDEGDEMESEPRDVEESTELNFDLERIIQKRLRSVHTLCWLMTGKGAAPWYFPPLGLP